MGGQERGQVSARREARLERRRSQTRAEILDAALAIVLRDGFDGFSLAAVAEDLELTKPALYYYFRSKRQLMFELLLKEWIDSAAEVQEAVGKTATGADAVEAIMRTLFARYRERPALFLLGYQRQHGELRDLLGKEELERIRPVNDMFYAGAEERLRADQARGDFPQDRSPRRFAFTAHMSVIGLLNMKAIVESVGDPLVHRDDDLIDGLCRTFRDASRGA